MLRLCGIFMNYGTLALLHMCVCVSEHVIFVNNSWFSYCAGTPLLPGCVVLCMACCNPSCIFTLHFDVHLYVRVITSFLYSPLLLPSFSFCSSVPPPSPFFLPPFFSPPSVSLSLPPPPPSSLSLHATANNPDMAPVQPTGTPPIFFDTQSSTPWEFSLNLSAVAPTSTSQLRPNASGPIIHGLVLRIIVEQNGKNTTHNHYMVCI